MNMNWKKQIFALTSILLTMLFVTTSTVGAKPSLQIDPGNFVSKVDNPYFPLEPGTTYIYRGETEGVPTRDVMTVTTDTKVILGVTTIVVRDQAYENGVLVEDTFDWYAQDKAGNVWYFGEDTKELDENGNVISTEGTGTGDLPGDDDLLGALTSMSSVAMSNIDHTLDQLSHSTDLFDVPALDFYDDLPT